MYDQHRETILKGAAEIVYLGKEFGNFKTDRPEFYSLADELRRNLGIKVLFVPSLNFTHRTASLTDPGERLLQLTADGLKPLSWPASDAIVRTEAKADGGLIWLNQLPDGLKPSEVALAGFNADCPFIMGIAPGGIFCMHAGLDCLQQPGQRDPRNIFWKMIRTFDLDRAALQVYISAGISHCCYGRNDGRFDEVGKIWGAEFLRTATKEPRVGQRSLDLGGLIRKAVLTAGVPADNIEQSNHCTSCDGRYWSNVRGEGNARNALVFKLK